MNRPDLYNKTIDILLNAFKLGRLKFGSVCGCAVGNLIAEGMGYEYNEKLLPHVPQWVDYDRFNNWHKVIHEGCVVSLEMTDEVLEEIRSTGYNEYELARIE